MIKSIPFHSGGEVHCSIHNTNTKVGKTERNVSEYFTVPCVYCIWEENYKLHTELVEKRNQVRALCDAIDIAKTVRLINE